jgi:hypothetical protein
MCLSDRRSHGREDIGGATNPEMPESVYESTKWERIEGAPRLLWAWAGSPVAGLPLGLLLKDATSDWPTLHQATKHVRVLCAAAPRSFTDCLIAGWVGDVPGILHVRYDASTDSWAGNCPTMKERFVGAGSLGADLAWRYAIGRGVEKSGDNFRSLVEMITREDPRLGGFEMWDIPPDGEPYLAQLRGAGHLPIPCGVQPVLLDEL